MSTGAILGTIGIVIAVVAIGVLIDRRWSLLPRPGELAAAGADAKAKPAPPEPPGTAAAAPLRLTPKKLAAALTAQRCAGCGARAEAGPGEPIRYAGAELQLFRLTCAQCGAARGLYVAVV